MTTHQPTRRPRDLAASDGFGVLTPELRQPRPFPSCSVAAAWLRKTRPPRQRPARLSHSLALLALLLLFPVLARADEAQPAPCALRHPMTDAWFTGPMLANTAATAPRGHTLMEPYVYDVVTQGNYTASGKRQSTPHQNTFGSLTYLIYALTDKVGIGFIPTFDYSTVTGAPSSAGPGPGDLTAQLQRRITQFQPCGWMPTISLAVQQTLPTGRYDQLGNRPTDGFGAGAYTTTPEFLSQMYFWLPNHRILRLRFNVTDAFSGTVPLRDASVYGTTAGFRGNARPGSSFYIDTSLEYSAERSWVLALDATWRTTGNTRVTGYYVQSSGAPGPVTQTNSGWSDEVGLAPAVEYSWKPWIGVLLGVRLFPAGRNAQDSITPAIAVNIVH